jgi:hypothetical protein
MTQGAASWTSDPFATQFERRADGSFLLRPLGHLAAYPRTLTSHLELWARAVSRRVR